MIRCISSIFCELADPPLVNQECSSSSVTFSSSIYEVSSQSLNDKWSSLSKKLPFFNSHIDNPFPFEGSEELSGPYCRMLKVQWIRRDTEKLRDVENVLQKFRLVFWMYKTSVLLHHFSSSFGVPFHISAALYTNAAVSWVLILGTRWVPSCTGLSASGTFV